MVDVRLGEVVGEQPEPGNHAVPAPAAVLERDDLDHQHVAGLGAADRDRAVERVDQLGTQPAEVLTPAPRGDLAGALARLEDDGVPGSISTRGGSVRSQNAWGWESSRKWVAISRPPAWARSNG